MSKKTEQIRPQVEKLVNERLLDLIDGECHPRSKQRKRPSAFDNPIVKQAFEIFGQKLNDGYPDDEAPEAENQTAEDQSSAKARRAKLMKKLLAGKLDDQTVEIEVEEAQNPFIQVFSAQGLEEMGLDVPGPLGQGRRTTRKVTVGEAKKILFNEEARKHIDKASLHAEAIPRTEQTGIIFLDEIDKVAGKTGGSGPDVSR